MQQVVSTAVAREMQTFISQCKTITSEEIYELFEDMISQELRDVIYDIADSDASEPCRNALIKLGYMYGVKSLIDF